MRIICASNRDLQAIVRDKEFREDLYYRCNVIEISIPPLRSRLEDIPVTANFFLSKYSTLLNKDIDGFSANALRQLNDYAWPGNVRELENLVERIVNLSDAGDILDVAAFLRTGSAAKPSARTSAAASPDTSSVVSLRDAERHAIEHALAACNLKLTRCATLLKVSKDRGVDAAGEHGSAFPSYGDAGKPSAVAFVRRSANRPPTSLVAIDLADVAPFTCPLSMDPRPGTPNTPASEHAVPNVPCVTAIAGASVRAASARSSA